MFRLRSLKPDKLAAAARRLSTPAGSNGKNSAPVVPPTVKGGQPSSNPPSVAGALTTSAILTAVSLVGLAYGLDTNKGASAFVDKYAPFINDGLAPIQSILRSAGVLDKIEPPAAVPKATAPPAPKIESIVQKVVEDHKTEVVPVPDVVETVKHAEEAAVTTVEETLDHSAGAAPEQPQEDVKVPSETEIESKVEEVFQEAQREAEHEDHFSAHHEVQELQTKYHLAEDSFSGEQAPAPDAAAPSGRREPSLNDLDELSQQTLHYELQTQARKILADLQEELHHTRIREMVVAHEQQLRESLKQKEEEWEARLKHDLEKQERLITRTLQDDLNHQVALLRQSQNEELLALQPRIEALKADLRTFEVVAEETAAAVQETLHSNQLSSAILALEFALSAPTGQRGNMSGHFDNLKSACKDDQLVSGVIAALPKSVMQNGALNNNELHLRFNIMKEEVRKVALAPEEAPPMVGQFIGTVLAKLTWAPKGYVAGSGVEDILARAEFHLERGHVKEALGELSNVKGYAKVLMRDFESLAFDRLVVDQSIAILKAKSVLKHKALVP